MWGVCSRATSVVGMVSSVGVVGVGMVCDCPMSYPDTSLLFGPVREVDVLGLMACAGCDSWGELTACATGDVCVVWTIRIVFDGSWRSVIVNCIVFHMLLELMSGIAAPCFGKDVTTMTAWSGEWADH